MYFNMNDDDLIVKKYLLNLLYDNGYVTFYKHLSLYDVHVTDDPTVAARVIPSKGLIEINNYFSDPDMLSMLVRHELLHLLLKHEKRAIMWLAERNGINPHHMKKSTFKKLRHLVYKRFVIPGFEEYGATSIINIAGDYEISTFYNDIDKKNQKEGDFFGSPLGGLVLELDHPEWLELSYEELNSVLADKLLKLKREAAKEIRGTYQDEDHFLPEIAREELGVSGEDVSPAESKSFYDLKPKMIMFIKGELKKYSDFSEFRETDDGCEFRHWGNWENPAEYEEEDDYDWQVLSDESINNLNSIVKKFNMNFKDYKLNYSIEEKNWIICNIE